VDKSNSLVFMTRLNTSISAADAHAIDIKYYKHCWTKHVFYAARWPDDTNKSSSEKSLQKCMFDRVNRFD
jgi:hypothetical protein